MRGFAAGSLALIVIYVVVQQGTANKLGSAGTAITELFKRAMSPGVAGLGNHSGAAATAPPVKPIATAASTGPYYTT